MTRKLIDEAAVSEIKQITEQQHALDKTLRNLAISLLPFKANDVIEVNGNKRRVERITCVYYSYLPAVNENDTNDAIIYVHYQYYAMKKNGEFGKVAHDGMFVLDSSEIRCKNQ